MCEREREGPAGTPLGPRRCSVAAPVPCGRPGGQGRPGLFKPARPGPAAGAPTPRQLPWPTGSPGGLGSESSRDSDVPHSESESGGLHRATGKAPGPRHDSDVQLRRPGHPVVLGPCCYARSRRLQVNLNFCNNRLSLSSITTRSLIIMSQ